MALGTVQQSKSEIEQALDFIGARADNDVSQEYSVFSASFARKDEAKVLGIMRDVVISPRFDKTEFDKHKTRYLSLLEQAKESPRNVIGSYFNQQLFGKQGYGSPVGGYNQEHQRH